MHIQKVGSDRRWFVLLTVGIGTFLSSLNTSSTNTILPIIEKKLHISLAQSEWIVLVYLLILTLFLLPFGRLSDLWGKHHVFLWGFLLFASASVLCALSVSYAMLVIGRGLLAFAGAMILSAGPALITTSFPAEQRGRVLGIQALMTYIGLAAGPVVGGWITQIWGWEATFLVSIPFAMLGFLIGFWAIPKLEPVREQHMHLRELISFMVSMGTLFMVLNSKVLTWHHQMLIVFLVILCILAGWIFLRTERKISNPMLDLHLFSIRNFGFGTLAAGLNYLCFFVTLFVLPFYLDKILHLSVGLIGTYLMIMPLIMMACAPLAGRLSDRIGSRILSTAGMIFSTIGLINFSLWVPWFGANAQTPLFVGLILMGLGTGIFAAPNNSAILGAAPREKQGMASGVLATFRYMGMMAGITLGGSLLDLFSNFLIHAGTDPLQSFLYAFTWVMRIAVLFGIIGVVFTLSMSKFKRSVPEIPLIMATIFSLSN